MLVRIQSGAQDFFDGEVTIVEFPVVVRTKHNNVVGIGVSQRRFVRKICERLDMTNLNVLVISTHYAARDVHILLGPTSSNTASIGVDLIPSALAKLTDSAIFGPTGLVVGTVGAGRKDENIAGLVGADLTLLLPWVVKIVVSGTA